MQLIILALWVRRSSKAVVIACSPNTWGPVSKTKGKERKGCETSYNPSGKHKVCVFNKLIKSMNYPAASGRGIKQKVVFFEAPQGAGY